MENPKEENKVQLIRFPQADSDAHARPKPKRAKGNKTPRKLHRKRRAKRAADAVQPSPQSQQLRPRTADDINNEQTAEQLALRIWAALVGDKTLSTMSGLVDELLDAHLLDDDDEEADDSWLDDHRKREAELLDEAIADGLEKYPDIDAINNLPGPSDPDSTRDMARDAKQLREVLAKCAIGATQFAKGFPRAMLERMVKRDIKERLEKDPKYSHHVRADALGSDIKKYGERGCTSSKGTFVKAVAYEHGGDLVTLLTGGWLRVAKDRVDPIARSYQFGLARKSNRQHWLHHYKITERSGKQSDFELKREALHGIGNAAIKQLLQSGVHVIRRKIATRALVPFLDWKPRREIIRMPQVGFFEVDGHYIYVRSNETLLPSALRGLKNLVYEAADASDPDHYGHQIKGTTVDWQRKVAIPLRGNSNVALAFAISCASPLIPFADEQRGGVHIFGLTGIGKTAILAVGESVYGLPGASEHPRSYGRTWAVTPTGLEDLLRFRNHAGLFLDELQRVPRENRGAVVQMIYAFTQVQKVRGGAWRLQGDGAGQVFLLSSGEDSIATFVGKDIDRGGRERRVPDIPAEVYPGAKSAFETIDHDALQEKLPALYTAMLYECHGAPGRDWQMWLVEQLAELGVEKIKERINQERQTFLALPQVRDIWQQTQPELRSIIRQFSLYAAALHLAVEANILPWTNVEADTGLVACLRRWVQRNTDPVIARLQFVTEFKRKLADDLAGCFIKLDKVKGRIVPATDSDIAKHAEQQNSRAAYDGYVKDGFVLIRPEAFVKRCVGIDHVEIAKYLHANGELLVSDKDGKYSKTVQTIGQSERVYVIPQTALAPGEDTPDTSDTSDPEK